MRTHYYRTAGLLLLMAVLIAPLYAQDAQEFQPSGRVWGYIFGDYYYKVSGEAPEWGSSQYARVEEDMHGGQLRRLYFGYDYAFSPKISSRVLLESNDKSTFANGSYGTFIKLGYVAWKEPIKGWPMTVSVGLIPTPVFAAPEKAWGYRSVEKEILDARGIGRSADQGVMVEGTFKRGGNAGYVLMVGNGSGTRVAQDPHKALYLSLTDRFFDKKMSVEVMGSYLGGKDGRSTTIGRLFLGAEPGPLKVGAEVSLIRDEASSAVSPESPATVNRLAASAFASFPVGAGGKIRGFGRYDYYDKDLDFDALKGYVSPESFNTEHMFIAGLDIMPTSRVHIMPNLWVNAYSARGEDTPSRKADIVPRMTFYFVF